MSFWPGGIFYGMPDLGPIEVPRGHYNFDTAGRLDKTLAKASPTLLADRINPVYHVSHRTCAPTAPDQMVGKTVLYSWSASLVELGNHVDALVDSRHDKKLFDKNKVRVRDSLDKLRQGIRDRVKVDRG